MRQFTTHRGRWERLLVCSGPNQHYEADAEKGATALDEATGWGGPLRDDELRKGVGMGRGGLAYAVDAAVVNNPATYYVAYQWTF